MLTSLFGSPNYYYTTTMKASKSKKMFWLVAMSISMLSYFYLLHAGMTEDVQFLKNQIEYTEANNVLPDVQLVKRVFEELSKVMQVSL